MDIDLDIDLPCLLGSLLSFFASIVALLSLLCFLCSALIVFVLLPSLVWFPLASLALNNIAVVQKKKDIDLDYVDLATTKEKEMSDDSTEIFDEHGERLIAVLEEDSDHNSEVWSAFFGSRSSLPKKGDLVVYFPQGHLEYENLHLHLPKEEVRTYDLQPQIICRVEHVQLMIKEGDDYIFAINDDDIYAKITLHPEPEVNSEEKELEQSDEDEDEDEDEDCICDEDGSPAIISTPSLFCKTLKSPDILILSIPPKAAIEFFCLDKESMDLQNEVTAKDFHGNEWKFPLIIDKKNGNWLLGWNEFTRARNFQQEDRVVFLREEDTKLRVGIRRLRDFSFPYIANDDPLSPAAGAILKKSIFSVMYGLRGNHADFVIPYQKYMKSITRPWLIGAEVYKQYKTLNSLERKPGVVTGMADLDPKNWPNSKWKCLTVTWEGGVAPFGSSRIDRVSPWEIVFDDSPSSTTFDSSLKLKRLWTIQQDNSPPMSYLGDIVKQTPTPQTSSQSFSESKSTTYNKKLKLKRPRTSTTKYKESKLKKPHTSQQDNSSPMPHLEKHKDLLPDEAIRSEKQKHVQEPGSIHCETDATNHPFDIEKETLFPDLCSLTSFSEIKSTTNYKELKISNCSVDDLWRHLKENHSYENLKFDSCSFPSSTRLPIPITVKKLKITNCLDTEQVFTVLMDLNLSVESLEIDRCSSFCSMSTGGIPATLRQLRIVNCMNLKSLSESFETEKSPSINEGVNYSMADILELRKLEIQNCQKLESLPKGLHKLRNLDLLSINDCCSLEYFPEGGLPITCLTSLSISGCENLKCLPNKLHKVTSLQNLSISGCSSLMLFPEGGLPPNLVSLCIIDCENLISLSQWELHKLKHLRKYSFSCGCSDSGE